MTVSLTTLGTRPIATAMKLRLQLAATDSAGHALTYSVSPSTPLPSGLTLDPGSGRIFGIVGSSDDRSSPYTVTLVATDGAAGVAQLQTVTWTVNAGSAGSYDSFTAEQGEPYAFTPANFSITPGDGTVGIQITSLPAGASLTDNGTPVTLNQDIPLSDIQNSALVYTPGPNELGPDCDSFNFTPYTNGGAEVDPTEEANVAKTANIQVTLPLGNAEVFFDRAPTTSTGTTRLYTTPPILTDGPTTVRATWEAAGCTVVDHRQVR